MTVFLQAIFIFWIAIALIDVGVSLGRLVLAIIAFGIACALQLIGVLIDVFWKLWRAAFLE